MKKIILSLTAVLAFGFTNAQDKKGSSEGFSKGDIFVSGSIQLGSTKKLTSYKTSDFTFAPKIGYFVSENIAAGIELEYTSGSSTATEGATAVKNSAFGFNAFGRYYFTPASKFSLFGQLNAGYATVDPNTDVDNNKVNAFGLGLGLGANYFVSSNFSIEAGLGVLDFTSAKGEWTGAENGSSFNFGGDWRAVSIGVNYKF
jgi:opacity protein-like surface antigen